MILRCRYVAAVRDEFMSRGWARFRESEAGKIILVVDASPDGEIPGLAEALAAGFWPDLVVCCYPLAAARENPDLVFLGAEVWDGKVEVQWVPNLDAIVVVAKGENGEG
jgi:hypothetical protein